jgi:hypothetical protein
MFAFGVALVVSFAHDAFTLRTWPIRVLSGVIALAIAYRLTRAGLGMFSTKARQGSLGVSAPSAADDGGSGALLISRRK